MASRSLTPASLHHLRKLWHERVRRLTLADLRDLGGAGDAGGCQLEAAQRTQWQLKVRLAHRLRDFLFLPYKVMAHPSVRVLYEKYAGAYNMHEDFGRLDSQRRAVEYWMALARTFEEHTNVTHLLGHCHQQLVHHDPALAPILDTFVGRFFVSRIGTRLLGAHFLNLGPVPPGTRKPAGVAMGVLQPTSPVGLIRNLSLSLSAPGSGGDRVPIDLEDGVGASILHIPGHVRWILREILSNAVVATARTAAGRGCEPAPIRVKVNRGQFGVFVTISDQGGGIACVDRVWEWGEERKRVPSGVAAGAELLDWTSGEAEAAHPGSVPLGFGLPLARLTARYFGGDIRLQTIMGYGTNAYVHIPELPPEEAVVGEDAAG